MESGLMEYQTARAVRAYEPSGWRRRRRQYRSARRQVDTMLGRDYTALATVLGITAWVALAVVFSLWWMGAV